MMLGKYGPYAEHFTTEQAEAIAQQTFLDNNVVYPPKAASPFPQAQA